MKKNTKIIFNVNTVNTELTTTEDNVVVFNDMGEYHYYKGKFHREDDLPAIITEYSEEWYTNGKKNRDESKGPAVISNEYTFRGNNIYLPFTLSYSYSTPFKNFKQIEYWKDGKLHRIGEPAVITTLEYEGIYYRFEYMFQDGILYGGDGVKTVRGFKGERLAYFQTHDKDGKLHSFNDKIASYNDIYGNDETGYYSHGLEHRDKNLPSFNSKRVKRWKVNNVYFREGDKAQQIEYFEDGSFRETYYKNIFYKDQNEYQNEYQPIHRTNGPAVIIISDTKRKYHYYVNGDNMSSLKFKFLKLIGKIN